MNVLEKEIEDMIWEGYRENPELIRAKGLPIQGAAIRQLYLGSYGIADMVTFRILKTVGRNNIKLRRLVVNVYELKKDEININTFLQALSYCKGIERYVNDNYDFDDVQFTINLVGKYINTEGTFCFIQDIINNVNIYTYDIDWQHGIVFKNENGYGIVDGNVNAKVTDLFLKDIVRNTLIIPESVF
jgi:hypothetical protein